MFDINNSKTVFSPKNLPILNFLSIVENIFSMIVLFVATWTLHKFSQTTLNYLHNFPITENMVNIAINRDRVLEEDIDSDDEVSL